MTEKDTVRRGYDGLAETYATERPDEGRGIELLNRILTPIGESARILDAGCGQGKPVLLQSSAEATAVGVDFSREQLGLATRNAPDASLTQGDMTNLPFQDETFDAITAYHSLIHVPMDEHRAAIDEFARVLRPDGRLLVSEGPGEWSGANPDWLESGVEMQWDIAGADATREKLRDAGFDGIDEWGAPNALAGDDGHWVFFSARFDG
jgi:SAM-dependent methyltransferase